MDILHQPRSREKDRRAKKEMKRYVLRDVIFLHHCRCNCLHHHHHHQSSYHQLLTVSGRFLCFPCNPRAAVCGDVTGDHLGMGRGHLSHSSLAGVFKIQKGSSKSLPGLRGEIVDLGQVLYRRAFVSVCQLDPHSQLLL